MALGLKSSDTLFLLAGAAAYFILGRTKDLVTELNKSPEERIQESLNNALPGVAVASEFAEGAARYSAQLIEFARPAAEQSAPLLFGGLGALYSLSSWYDRPAQPPQNATNYVLNPALLPEVPSGSYTGQLFIR